MSLNQQQIDKLLSPIHPGRVGKDGKGFSHLEAWDVRATLIRIFGFEWSATTDQMELVFETEAGGKWSVAYRAKVLLEVNRNIYSEWAIGDAKNQPHRADAHDLAIKMAESQALKRCAVNLGDQFGLSLYNSGSTAAVVTASLAYPRSPAVEMAQNAARAVLDTSPVRPAQPLTTSEAAVLSEQDSGEAKAADIISRIPAATDSRAVGRLIVEAANASVMNVQVRGKTVQQHLQEATK